MPASMSEPHDGLLLINSLAGIAQCAPPGQVVTIGLIHPLPAISQLLGTVRPLVSTGKVRHKLLFEINLAIYTSDRQIIQPYPGWTF
jgi:hypothetical protein